MPSFNEQLNELHIFVEQMQATSSSLEKVEILKKQSGFIQGVLNYTYDPYKQYNLTAKTLIKNKDILGKYGYYDLFYLLDALSNRAITGHEAIAHVNGFMVGLDLQGKELVCRIIDKDLEIRAGAKVINKAFPNLIPEFNVALAQNYEPKLASFGEDATETWYASRKLDGVRCLAVVDEEGKCTLYSRMGKEFTTLNKVKEAIEATSIINTVFDGEICLMDEDGNEDFQGVMKQLRRKDHQIENPVFMIFDMIHKIDFEKGKSEDGTILSDRLHTLRSFIEGTHKDTLPPIDRDIDTSEVLRYLDQYVITDGRHFDKWAQMATDNNWEGFMLRKDTFYEGKRSKNLLKVKKFHDAEYTVKAVDFDRMRIVKDGREEYLDMLSQVWIEHKGYEVKVGSGFSQEQRLKYTQEPIVGKTITVQYFEETTNDKGGISLRFPTVKHIYEGKRDC